MSDFDLDAAERRLAEVEAALERLDDGSYGRCAVCGEPLPPDGLARDPLATTCAGCGASPTEAAPE